MASEVDICNMALAHLGEDGVVASITPPDGSAEAGHCARFYRIARGVVLEMHEWAFAAARKQLAQVTNDSTAWAYKLALPSDCVKPRKLLPYGVYDETKSINFVVEGTSLYCNDEVPTLLYTKSVTDTTKYTNQFVSCLSYQLASYVAGPIVKKAATVRALAEMAVMVANQAAATDANASVSETHSVPAPWIATRGGENLYLRDEQQ